MMDRRDTIMALRDAYKTDAEKEKEKNRVITESINFDGHTVSRIIHIEDEDSKCQALYMSPEAAGVRTLVSLMKDSGESMARQAAINLEKRFMECAKAGDSLSVNRIMDASKGLATKLGSVPANSPQRVMMLLLVTEEVKKL